MLVGLGSGFLLVYLVDLLVRQNQALWWPIIPGGITLTVGLILETGNQGTLADAAPVWPIALVLVGALLLLRQLGTRRDHDVPPTTRG